MEVKTRPLVAVDVDVRDAEDPLEAVGQAVGEQKIAGAVVKLTVRHTLEQANRLRDIDLRRLLAEAEHIASIQRHVERPRRLRLGDLGSIAGRSPRELLERYLEQRQVEPREAHILLRYAEEIWGEEAGEAVSPPSPTTHVTVP
ncbi:MAG: hypothetical protein Q9O62_04720 [Ardenticatenia bacterium]|nr:hypothetical protein [Ardenticatenia bacterium]